MQFDSQGQVEKSQRKEVWILKEVYVELEGDRIRFYLNQPSEDEMMTKDVSENAKGLFIMTFV